MKRTERYEGSDHRVYTIEFLNDSYEARVDGEIYVAGPCPEELPASLSWAEAARLAAISKIERKIKRDRAARKKLARASVAAGQGRFRMQVQILWGRSS